MSASPGVPTGFPSPTARPAPTTRPSPEAEPSRSSPSPSSNPASGPSDQASLSPDAHSAPPSPQRNSLLDALKNNYGGNDRLRDTSSQWTQMSDEQLASVRQRREMDKAITQHEEDHHRVAGNLARSGCVYETETGEDGQQYRKAGHVMIDMTEDKDPQKTVEKMKQVREAALAPESNVLAPLSEQDKKVAREASEKQKRAEDRLAGRPVEPSRDEGSNSAF